MAYVIFGLRSGLGRTVCHLTREQVLDELGRMREAGFEDITLREDLREPVSANAYLARQRSGGPGTT